MNGPRETDAVTSGHGTLRLLWAQPAFLCRLRLIVQRGLEPRPQDWIGRGAEIIEKALGSR